MANSEDSDDDLQVPDVIYRWTFNTNGNMPRVWLSSAETLLAAARAVKKAAEEKGGQAAFEQGLMIADYQPYALLLGYAIECLLKARWVKNGNKLVRDGRLLNEPPFGKHELGKMARTVGVTLSPKELSVLDRLSSFVQFAGRYPIPPTWEQTRPVRTGGAEKIAPNYFGREDFQRAELVAKRLKSELLYAALTQTEESDPQ